MGESGTATYFSFQTDDDRLWPTIVGFGVPAAISASAAVVVSAAPTGIPVWDLALISLTAVLVVAAGLHARPWSLVVVLAITAPLCSSVELQIAAAVGIVAISVNGGTDARVWHPYLGAATGGIGFNCALRMNTASGPLDAFFGLPTVVGAAAILPVLLSAYRSLAPDHRRIATRALLGAGACLAVAGVLIGSVLVQTRADLVSARSTVATLSGAVGATDPASLQQDLATASEQMLRAADPLESWRSEPALLVPIVAQHIRAIRAAASEGGASMQRAHEASLSASPERLRSETGQVDLAALAETSATIDRLHVALLRADRRLSVVQSGWLLPQVARPIAAGNAQVARALPPLGTAAEALRVLPQALGSEGSRTYLVLLATPAESRELGGFVGGFVELRVTDGDLEIARQGHISDLFRLGPSDFPSRDDYPLRYLANDPQRYPQNWAGLPDLPLVARAVGEMYPSIGGSALDGVVYVDPIGLAALVGLVEPLAVPGFDAALTASATQRFLLVNQYADFDDKDLRIDAQQAIATALFGQLLAADLADPMALMGRVAPAVHGGHLQISTFDSAVNDVLATVGADGAFPEPGPNDFLAVIQANAAPNKLDTFLERSVAYDVVIDPGNGSLTGTVTVDLRNTADANLPEYVLGSGSVDGEPGGTNLVHLSIYTPHFLEEVFIGGRIVPVERQQELGYQRYLVMVPVELGAAEQVVFRLSGMLPSARTGPYELVMPNQPLVNDDDVTVRIERGIDVDTTSLNLTGDTRIELLD